MDQSRCVYCGIRIGETRDHVPPKALFPKPKPSNLVTVPCCEECRATQSVDDEYFKNVIVIRHDVAAHPAATQVLDSVHRALARPQNLRFTKTLIRLAKEVDVQSLGGLFIGRATTYDVDLKRLDSVIRRTMLGLFWHETGERLPDSCISPVFCVEGIGGLDIAKLAGFRRAMDQALTGRPTVFGHKVFTYWFQRLPGPNHATLWAFLVYSRVAFLGFTGPAPSVDAA